jgi:hypothetical protein
MVTKMRKEVMDFYNKEYGVSNLDTFIHVKTRLPTFHQGYYPYLKPCRWSVFGTHPMVRIEDGGIDWRDQIHVCTKCGLVGILLSNGIQEIGYIDPNVEHWKLGEKR